MRLRRFQVIINEIDLNMKKPMYINKKRTDLFILSNNCHDSSSLPFLTATMSHQFY